MPPLNKQMNEYASMFYGDVYAATPKAVLAAVVASVVVNNGAQVEGGDSVDTYLLREWLTLHRNGLVPQAPPRRLLKLYGLGA